MSKILKDLAQMNLKVPDAVPSGEAAHAALLLAHVGWNRALGHAGMHYEPVLQSIERARPEMWSELLSRDCEAMIEAARGLSQEPHTYWTDQLNNGASCLTIR